MAETDSVQSRALPQLSEARLARLRARVSLLDLASRSGVPLVVISEWERGIRTIGVEREKLIQHTLDQLADRGPGVVVSGGGAALEQPGTEKS
jgi:transcriptional regulator with XRE-family HTH domain